MRLIVRGYGDGKLVLEKKLEIAFRHAFETIINETLWRAGIMTDDFRQYRSDDPRYNDPRFQRRVMAIHRPIAMIDNMFDVTLECGHAPLLFSDAGLEVGAQCFCPYEQSEASS